jgi:uncharacterized membrane protein
MTEEAYDGHRLERLVFFSDAIFAIAITLLIIEIRVPHLPPDATNTDWINAIAQLWPSLVAFSLSFIVIGAMWARHHATFAMVYRFSQSMMWPNLLLLMSIAFLPFSTAVMGIGRPSAIPYAFYSGSLLVASLMKTWLNHIVLRPEFVAPGVTAAQITGERRRSWIMPTATAAAFGLAFVAPGWNNLAMILIMALRRLPFFKDQPTPAEMAPVQATILLD